MVSSCLGIRYLSFSHDIGTEIPAYEAWRVQVDFSAGDFTEFEFKPRESDLTDPRFGLEFHKNIHITVRAK